MKKVGVNSAPLRFALRRSARTLSAAFRLASSRASLGGNSNSAAICWKSSGSNTGPRFISAS
jgi:hypothetical protein